MRNGHRNDNEMYTEGFQIAKESLSGKGLKALTTLQELVKQPQKGAWIEIQLLKL
jgi:hypothetical protein